MELVILFFIELAKRLQVRPSVVQPAEPSREKLAIRVGVS